MSVRYRIDKMSGYQNLEGKFVEVTRLPKRIIEPTPVDDKYVKNEAFSAFKLSVDERFNTMVTHDEFDIFKTEVNARFDTMVTHDEFDTFKTEVNTRFDTMVTHDEFDTFKTEVNARFDTMVTHGEFDTFKTEVNARFDKMDDNFAELKNLILSNKPKWSKAKKK